MAKKVSSYIKLQISDFNGLNKLDNLNTICVAYGAMGGVNLLKSKSNIFIK